MAVLLQLHNGSKSFGGRPLLDNASFSVNENEHIGVIGPNGAGKSTLFRILVGEESLDSGQVVKSQHLRIGYLAQDETASSNAATVEEFLESKTSEPLWNLKKLGNSLLGLNDEHFKSRYNALSGGFRMRCQLLALLGDEPNLLLLDEPTNYLDLESVLTLERFLIDFEGSFLLISHDREFLRRTTDHTLEIENTESTKFSGNIDDYFEQKQKLREHLQKQALKQEQRRQEILKFAARFRAQANKARQVQSKLKELDRMESIEINPLPTAARIHLPEPVRTGKIVLETKDLALCYGDTPVLTDVGLRFQRGEHVAIVGVNGAGKTTLLKGLSGVLSPHSGHVEWGHRVEVGYYAQHVAEALDPAHTIYEALAAAAHPDVLPQEVRDMAGSLLFSADDINKTVKILSGGEKARVALGGVLLKKAPCLLLDEPTNHLDFHTVEALTQALSRFSGTLVVVSHDRSFVKRVANRIVEIRDGTAHLYPGRYEEYIWSTQQGVWAQSEPSQKEPAPQKSEKTEDNKSNYKERKKDLQKRIKKKEKHLKTLDQNIQTAQNEMESLNEQLTKSSGPEAESTLKTLNEKKKELEQMENEWLEVSENLEAEQAEWDNLT